jgi:hypothetical protein
MSLPMWPSAFIPVAVEMCSGSSTLLGRANFGEVARVVARLRAVRSLISSRSYSATDPRTPIIIRPAAADESMPSVTYTLTVCRWVAVTLKTSATQPSPLPDGRFKPCGYV